MAQLALALLGPLQATLDGVPIAGFESQKVRALLAYLALEADRPHGRDALAGLLWPNQPDQAARNNLRQALANLRQALGDQRATSPYLRITGATIQFNRDSDHQIDVVAFSDYLDACDQHPHRHPATCRACALRLQQALDQYHGDLLSSFFLADSPAFEEWVLLNRERLRQRALAALAQLADYYERRGESTQAQHATRRQLELDPWREESHRQLMRLLALSGQRGAALMQYATCRRVLADELGVAPEEETTVLYERIQRGEALTDAQSVRAPINLAAHTPPTALIGRVTELARLVDRLEQRDCRLLTLIGPGGIGKTRLAIQAAADLHMSFRDGVCFVALAPLRAAEFVVPTIADALGLALHGTADPNVQLMAYLRAQDMLLVLDNFEHLLTAAPLVSELLAVCPDLVVLATSRAPLHVRGEQQFPVPPLALPPTDDRRLTPPDRHSDVVDHQLSAITQYAAVQLFIQRAQAVQPNFVVTETNVPDVTAICARLDGLPLAIELAAAWVKLFPPQALLTQLSSRLTLLTGGARDLPARQQTLRNTIAWSYDLLTAAEQRLFRCLSVFVGGCTIEATIAVYGTTVDPNADVLEGLAAVLNQSLLQQETDSTGVARFTMLETIRDYAIEQLQASDEAEAIHRRHAEHYLALADAAYPHLTGAEQALWLNRLAREHDNLRAAVGWAVESGEIEVELRLIAAVWRLWEIHGYWSEGRAWLDRVLMRSSASEPTLVQAKAQLGAGVLALMQGDYTVARTLLQKSGSIWAHLQDKQGLALSLRYLAAANWDPATTRSLDEQSLAIYRESEDKRDRALALETLGDLAWTQGAYAQAGSYYADGLALFRELSDNRNIAQMLHNLGDVALLQSDYASARTPYEESLALFRELSDQVGIANTLGNLGDVALGQGDYQSARAHYEERLAISRNLGHKWGMAIALGELGNLARCERDYGRTVALYEESLAIWRELENKGEILWALGQLACAVHTQGDDRRATALFEECLELAREQGDKPGIAGCLEGLARIAAMHGQSIRAIRLFAAGVRLRETIGDQLHRQPIDRAEHDINVTTVRARLNDATFTAAWAAGQALPLEQAIAEALQTGALATDSVSTPRGANL